MNSHEILGAPFLEKEIFGGLPIIAISGSSRSGKGTIAGILEKRLSVKHVVTTSDFIAARLKTKGMQPPYNRWQMGAETNDYHEKRGTKDIWARFALHKIGTTHLWTPLIGASTDGFRHREEYLLLKQFSNVSLVWVDAPQKIRAERERASLNSRGEKFDMQSFIQRDEVEADQMVGMSDMSETIFDNSRTLPDLEESVVDFFHHRFSLP